MALHEQAIGKSDEWYTPPHVFEALGVRYFDMDVASPGAEVVPWIPAEAHLTKAEPDEWNGFIWMNPPFGGRNGLVPWLDKFAAHAWGICLIPDRTSAPWWQKFIPRCDLVLFVSPKLKFISGDGTPNNSPAQGTCLCAIGTPAEQALYRASKTLGTLMVPT